MLTIADTLLEEDVLLDLALDSPEEVIDQTAKLLNDDERILDWSTFYGALKAHPPCRVGEDGDYGICIPHARTTAVEQMVMSASRMAREIRFPECTKPVRYVFCIGVPKALASDYLRIAGALMRIFKDPEAEQALHRARNPAEFVRTLSLIERKL